MICGAKADGAGADRTTPHAQYSFCILSGWGSFHRWNESRDKCVAEKVRVIKMTWSQQTQGKSRGRSSGVLRL